MVISSSTRKQNLGPSFFLGLLEVSPPTYLASISLLATCKSRVGEEPPSQETLFPPFQRQLGRRVGAVERAKQEGREKMFSKSGKKENAKGLKPNLSLFKNEIFPKRK